MASEFTAMLLFRAKSLLDAESKIPFAKDETTLGSQAAIVNKMDSVLQQQFSSQYAAMRSQTDQMAPMLLGAACADRKTTRTTTPRSCPNISAADAKKAQQAKAMLESAEKLVDAYAATAATRTPASSGTTTASASSEKSPEGHTIYQSATGLAKFGEAPDYLLPENHPYGDNEHPADCGYGMDTLQIGHKEAAVLTSARFAYVYAPLGHADNSKPLVWKLYGYQKNEINSPAAFHLYVVSEDTQALKSTIAAWKQAEAAHQTAKRDAQSAPFDSKMSQLSETLSGGMAHISMRRCGIKGNPNAMYVARAHRQWLADHKSQLFTIADKNATSTAPVVCKADSIVVALDGPGAFSLEGKSLRSHFVELGSLQGFGDPMWAILAEQKDDRPDPNGARKLLYVKKDEGDVVKFMSLLRPPTQPEGEILAAARKSMSDTFEMEPLKLIIDGNMPRTWVKCQ